MKNLLKNPKVVVLIIIIIAAVSGLSFLSKGKPSPVNQSTVNNGNSMPGMEDVNVPVETVSNGDVSSLGSTSISWPGEIVSYSDIQITPSRDGQIAEWNIKIGDYVKAGTVLGRLNPPPSSLELTSLLADKNQALVNTKAQAEATQKLVEASKKRLEEIKAALYKSRDTALDVAAKEALQNSSSASGATQELAALKNNKVASVNSAKAGLEQAQAILPVRFDTARAAFKALSQRFSGIISENGAAPATADQVSSMRINYVYGIRNSKSREEYLSALSKFFTALNPPDSLPGTEATAYIQASLKLLSNTMATDQLKQSDLKDQRDIIIEDQQTLLDALKYYQEAKSDVDIEKANLEKLIAEKDQDIINSETNVRTSKTLVDSTESIKANKIADVDKEFTKEKTDLDLKLEELNLQIDLSNAQVDGANAAYSMVESGLGSEIIATQSGVVSGIYKKVGDFVTVDTPLAMISGKNLQDHFVRFSIPSDMQMSKKGEKVIIERPGYLEPKEATITGIGLSLDDYGSYQADALFDEPVDWPVNASVRVISSAVSNFILIPLTAVWWDEQGASNIWVVDVNNIIKPKKVTLGRALGDRIEVEEGLNQGDRFVSVPTPELKAGQMVADSSSKITIDEKAQKPEDPMEGMSM